MFAEGQSGLGITNRSDARLMHCTEPERNQPRLLPFCVGGFQFEAPAMRTG